MSTDTFDWGLREAAEIVEFLTRSDASDCGFKEAIDKAIAVVEREQEAQQQLEAAKRLRIEKARKKAKTIRDQAIIPLLNDLCADFAADEEKVLPQWEVESRQDADTFSGAVVTPCCDATGSTRFTISAESTVVDSGDSVNLSVACSLVNPNNTSADKPAPLFANTMDLPAEQKFDERNGRTWLYRQVAECARMCVVTRMRQVLG
jgi:hypothetical protein